MVMQHIEGLPKGDVLLKHTCSPIRVNPKINVENLGCLVLLMPVAASCEGRPTSTCAEVGAWASGHRSDCSPSLSSWLSSRQRGYAHPGIDNTGVRHAETNSEAAGWCCVAILTVMSVMWHHYSQNLAEPDELVLAQMHTPASQWLVFD